MGLVVGDHYEINDATLLNLARLLPDTLRLKLFEELYQAVGSRPLEKIWLETAIRKQTYTDTFLRPSQRKADIFQAQKIRLRLLTHC